jgi:hypothetical protein
MTDTATATLNIDAVGAKAIRKHVSVNLNASDIKANQIVIMAYEGATDVFHLISPAAGSDNLPSATAMVFYQDAAPAGWTIAAAVDEHSIRLTKGSGAGGQAGGAAGGSVNFSTVFGLTATDGHILTEAELPSTIHDGLKGLSSGTPRDVGTGTAFKTVALPYNGADDAHTHAIDLQVKWAACIVATKD